MKKIMALAVVMGLSGLAFGGTIRPLTMEMQGRYGATHFLEIGYADLVSCTSSNLAYTNTFRLLPDTTFRFVAYELLVPFVGAATTNTKMGDATITFGTADSASAFLASTQIGTNGTAWWKAGVPALTLTLVKATNTIVFSGADTNVLTTNTLIAVTDVIASSVTAETLYTAATNVMSAVITPAANQALGWATAGKLRLFMQVRAPYGR